jgi:transposase-like protein
VPNKAKTANLIINPAAIVQRDSKGRFLKQPPPSVRDPEGDAHRPSLYDEKAQKYADDWFAKKKADKQITWIEELALELGVDDNTLVRWVNETDDKGNFLRPKFRATYQQIMAWQKMVLKNNGISGKFNGRMSMFLLSANHETVEKREVKADHTTAGRPIDMTGIPTATDEGVNEFITQGLKQKYVRPAR